MQRVALGWLVYDLTGSKLMLGVVGFAGQILSIQPGPQASPYHEERTEYTVGGDYLHGKSLMSLAYTNSEESDYLANAVSFDISQDMFGDLTTVSLGYMRNWNVVGMSTDSNFEQDADSQRYRVGITQVLTKDLIAALSVEAVTDEGYLNNPYRSVRYVDPSSSIGYSWIGEVYPNTRTSNATALRARASFPGDASAFGPTGAITRREAVP